MNSLLPFQKAQLEHLGYYTDNVPVGYQPNIDYQEQCIKVITQDNETQWYDPYYLGCEYLLGEDE
jgi:hypothetical protein